LTRTVTQPIISAMRRLGAVGLAALVSLAVAGGPSASRPAAAVVAYVYDGDTVRLQDGRRVRLLQIDTPELASHECYSRGARAALISLVHAGSGVALETDPALDSVDRYGRLLRYVRREGVNVNLELVRRGAAAPYFYRGERGRYAGQLLAAARRAKATGRGLWGACPGTALEPDHAVDTGTSATTTAPSGERCDPSYVGVCIPPPPPDLDCADIRAMGVAPVRVVGSDPHRLDGDGDGWGCE